jgi:hypothetical protein
MFAREHETRMIDGTGIPLIPRKTFFAKANALCRSSNSGTRAKPGSTGSWGRHASDTPAISSAMSQAGIATLSCPSTPRGQDRK